MDYILGMEFITHNVLIKGYNRLIIIPSKNGIVRVKAPKMPTVRGLTVATPLWRSVRVKPNTPKVGDLESSGTPECLGFDSKAQNTLH
jgi:hypothetical protein